MNLRELSNIPNVEVLENTDLSRFTTIKLKLRGNIAVVSSTESLKKVMSFVHAEGLRYHVLGWGANQVLSSSQNTIFIKLKFDLDRTIFKSVHSKYHLPASSPLNVLQAHAQKFGLKGWEVMTGIPASLGGAIYMNAGTALGEICEIVESVDVLQTNGEIRKELIDSNSFSYRKNNFVKDGEIIISATLFHNGQDPEIGDTIKNYMAFRKKTQPLSSFNCGCVWKNFDENHKAGLFIDKLKLNLLKFNEMEVSDKHCNFLENKGGATFEDFNTLIQLTQEELLLHTGIKFELEAKIY